MMKVIFQEIHEFVPLKFCKVIFYLNKKFTRKFCSYFYTPDIIPRKIIRKLFQSIALHNIFDNIFDHVYIPPNFFYCFYCF